MWDVWSGNAKTQTHLFAMPHWRQWHHFWRQSTNKCFILISFYLIKSSWNENINLMQFLREMPPEISAKIVSRQLSAFVVDIGIDISQYIKYQWAILAITKDIIHSSIFFLWPFFSSFSVLSLPFDRQPIQLDGVLFYAYSGLIWIWTPLDSMRIHMVFPYALACVSACEKGMIWSLYIDSVLFEFEGTYP